MGQQPVLYVNKCAFDIAKDMATQSILKKNAPFVEFEYS